MNSGGSPERVVVCHLSDEVYLRLVDLRSAGFRSALPPPVQSESFSMPPDDCLGLDDHERLLPGTEDTFEKAEE
jgi:hypothetical protein